MTVADCHCDWPVVVGVGWATALIDRHVPAAPEGKWCKVQTLPGGVGNVLKQCQYRTAF